MYMGCVTIYKHGTQLKQDYFDVDELSSLVNFASDYSNIEITKEEFDNLRDTKDLMELSIMDFGKNKTVYRGVPVAVAASVPIERYFEYDQDAVRHFKNS